MSKIRTIEKNLGAFGSIESHIYLYIATLSAGLIQKTEEQQKIKSRRKRLKIKISAHKNKIPGLSNDFKIEYLFYPCTRKQKWPPRVISYITSCYLRSTGTLSDREQLGLYFFLRQTKCIPCHSTLFMQDLLCRMFYQQ